LTILSSIRIHSHLLTHLKTPVLLEKKTLLSFSIFSFHSSLLHQTPHPPVCRVLDLADFIPSITPLRIISLTKHSAVLNSLTNNSQDGNTSTMSSRTPSIYSDALETPLEDPHQHEEEHSYTNPSIRYHQLHQHATAAVQGDPNTYSTEQNVIDNPAEDDHDNEAVDQNVEPMEEDSEAQVYSVQRQHHSEAATMSVGRREDMDVDEDTQQQGGSSSMQVDSVTQSQDAESGLPSVLVAASTTAASYAQISGSGPTAPITTLPPETRGLPTTEQGTPGAGPKTSAPAVDEKAQSELRRKIMEIQRDPNIKFADKAGMIQAR
jgi:hypothetical protein